MFNPLEDFNLSSLAIKIGDSARLGFEVVGKKSVGPLFSKGLIDNESKVIRILSSYIVSSGIDSLVRYKVSMRIHLSTLKDFILHVVLGSCNKPDMLLMKMSVTKIKLYITFVKR